MYILANRLTVLRGVHGSSCTAPKEPCNCGAEEQQYNTAGILAIVGGIVEYYIGWLFSMLVKSDSLHSLVDGTADLLGGWVARKAKEDPLNADEVRRKGNRVIAVLMLVGAVWIAYEVSSRLFGGHHFVAPVWIMLAGLGKGIIDVLRTRILSNAHRTNPNDTVASLLIHAMSDIIHSFVAVIVGGLMWISELAATDIRTVLQVVDLVLSLLLAMYMTYLSWLIWYGKHHGHYLLQLLFRLMGKELPHHYHH